MGESLTIQSVLVLNESLLTLRVWRLVGLCQSAPGALGHLSLVEGLGKPYHWHVLPLALASVVLLQHAIKQKIKNQNVTSRWNRCILLMAGPIWCALALASDLAYMTSAGAGFLCVMNRR